MTMLTNPRVEITIGTSRGEQQTIAHVTETPGLVVHPNVHGDGSWAVTHQRSGTAVCFVEDPEHAMWAAHHLGEVGVWTGSHAQLMAGDIDQAAVRSFCDRTMLDVPRYRTWTIVADRN